MASTVEMSASWGVLSETMSRIRQRWRMRLALHGLMIVLGAALLTLLVGAWVMWLFHFNSPAIAAVRIIAYATVATLVVRYVVLPLRRSASDTQVALYLEEHEPSLDAVVISAVETGTREIPASMRSPRLIARVVDMAAARVTAIRNDIHIENASIKTSMLALLGIVMAGTVMVGLGPKFMRTGARLLALPGATAHMFISVEPGNAEVNRGGDQAIRARLHDFDADRAELVMQHGSGKWERLPMTVIRDSAAFVIRLFAIKERTTYYIDAGGMRSPTYYLDIVDVPSVRQMTLEYHYPSYTGLAPKIVQHTGDISAPEGTTVIVRATTTMPVQGGRIAIAGQPVIPMSVGAGRVLSGNILVTAPGFYKIELQGSSGSFAPGSLGYVIDVQKDKKPTLVIIKPGLDVIRLPGEDLLAKVKANDDYGIATIDIKYSVNGGAEQIAHLPVSPSRREIVDDYTFPLKQLAVVPGDVVSFYAEATDNDGIHGGKVVRSDMYFARIMSERPPQNLTILHDRSKGPQTKKKGTFVQQERAIVFGTSRVDHDKTEITAETRREDLTTLTLAQRSLREEVGYTRKEIAERLVKGNGDSTSNIYKSIVDELDKAMESMQEAEAVLAKPDEHAAMSPELRAMQHLQRAEDFIKVKKRKPIKLGKNFVAGGLGGGASGPREPDGDMEHLFDPAKDELGDQSETRNALKQLADSASHPVLGGINDVPLDFQALVSEYYRSLAKRP